MLVWAVSNYPIYVLIFFLLDFKNSFPRKNLILKKNILEYTVDIQGVATHMFWLFTIITYT